MGRIVPSQVVALIDAISAADSHLKRTEKVFVDFNRGASLKSILAVANSVPEELLTLDSDDYTRFTCGKAAIEAVVENATHRSNTEEHHNPLYLQPIAALGGITPVFLLRDALAKCPDQFPAVTTSTLIFVESPYREVLRLDLSEVNRALTEGEWKASTVLAGSVVEALLLWAVRQQSLPAIQAVVSQLQTSKVLSRQPNSDLDWWDLSQFLEVSFALGLIGDSTAKQVRLAKDFRNFIHPGRSLREKQQCNRGTALSAVSAVEHVVEDLTKRFPPQP
jgi:hypothetical protein